jgi:5-formaminoimidazole-4-carboxamide-1-(beta)-D-ribofuranosyl 5'-monophosphate synthetase
MISRQRIIETVKAYDPKNITIGVLGGHSALDVCHGAKKYGFRTVAVCQKGREKTYDKYFRTRTDMDVVPGQLPPWHATKGVIDEVILVDKFSDIVKPEVQQKLRDLNTVFVHNRYFWVYCDFNQVENDFIVPIFGTREMVKLEERDAENNQYYLLEQAGVRTPKIFSVPEEIDRLAIVKVSEALRGYERAFFVVANADQYMQKEKELIEAGIVTKEGFEKAVIEEFVLGAQVNLNYFYSSVDDELELMGTDMRRQTNLDGLLRLPAIQQMEVLKHTDPKMIEMGHVAVTMKESLLEKAFDIGEKFVELTKREVPPGIIGPFALQGAVTAEEGKEEFVIFDVSLRIPGSPGTRFTPYSGYLYGDSISYGERIAMEVQTALKAGKLEQVVT